MAPDPSSTNAEQRNVELAAIGKKIKRAATPEEIHSARPFFAKGNGMRAKTGVLFLHGFTATPSTFRDYAERVLAEGFTVSVPLLPGHGANPGNLRSITYDDWLDSSIEAFDTIQSTCNSVYVVGISLGGALALHLSTRRDKIPKLFLISPAVFPLAILSFSRAIIFPVLETFRVHFWKSVAGDIKKEDGYELAYPKTAFNGLRQLESGMKQVQSLLPEVTTDVLIFQGKTDHEITPDKATTIIEEIQSQEKELVWLTDSYHEIPRDNDGPAVLARIIQDLIAASD